MKLYSIAELFTLTRTELIALHAAAVAALASYAEGSPGREILLANLRNIRRVLGGTRCAPD